MGDIAIYQEELNRYYKLKGDVSNIASLLKNASDNYEEIAKEESETYIVDNDITPVYNDTMAQQKEIYKTSDYLENVIIPEIDSKINSLRQIISSLIAAAEKAKVKKS